jgi:hypothetical protein
MRQRPAYTLGHALEIVTDRTSIPDFFGLT